MPPSAAWQARIDAFRAAGDEAGAQQQEQIWRNAYPAPNSAGRPQHGQPPPQVRHSSLEAASINRVLCTCLGACVAITKMRSVFHG